MQDDATVEVGLLTWFNNKYIPGNGYHFHTTSIPLFDHFQKKWYLALHLCLVAKVHQNTTSTTFLQFFFVREYKTQYSPPESIAITNKSYAFVNNINATVSKSIAFICL